MKRYIYPPIIALLLAGLACAAPPPSETPTAPPETPTATQPAQTPTASPTPIAPTQTPAPVPGGNLFENPGFEGPFHYTVFDDRNGSMVQFSQVNIADGWEAWFCDYPYTEGPCPAERRGTGNPTDLVMGRPEFKPIYLRPQHGGDTAQQFFCAFRTCRSGVWQTVETMPGHTYRISAWVQSWSSYDQDIESELITQDDRDNSQWRIVVDFAPPRQIYSVRGERLINTEASPVLAGTDHYDHWALLEWEVEAESDVMTVYFENLRLFPFPNNDNYLDDAEIICLDCNQVFPTPTRVNPGHTPTPGPSPTPEATALGDANSVIQGTFMFTVETNVRECPFEGWDTALLEYFLGVDPISSCPVVDVVPVGQAVRSWGMVNTLGDNTFGWLGTTVEADESLRAKLAVVCYNGVTRARYYPGFKGSIDNLPAQWVDPCGISGGAQDVIAPQSEPVRSSEMDSASLLALLWPMVLTAVAIVLAFLLLAPASEELIEFIQSIFPAVDPALLKTALTWIAGGIGMLLSLLPGLHGLVDQVLAILTPNLPAIVIGIKVIAALVSLFGVQRVLDWLVTWFHGKMQAQGITTRTRGGRVTERRLRVVEMKALAAMAGSAARPQ